MDLYVAFAQCILPIINENVSGKFFYINKILKGSYRITFILYFLFWQSQWTKLLPNLDKKKLVKRIAK